MKKQKTQILFIHGGMTFKNKKDYIRWLKTREISIEPKKRWHEDHFKKNLGKKCEIIKPYMPLSENAKYSEWKIHFERYIPFLKNKVILIGSSLGGIFLAKYLSENKFSKKILSVYLVAPPFDNTIQGEDLAGGFKLKKDLSLFEKNCANTYLFFSKNDDAVPVAHAEKYRKKLKNSKIIFLKNIKGHFQISKFPLIINMIKKDLKRIK